jgi:hypothetical protein
VAGDESVRVSTPPPSSPNHIMPMPESLTAVDILIEGRETAFNGSSTSLLSEDC